MRKVKQKNTSIELIVRKYLFHSGFRYRINSKNLPGKPDIVIRKIHTVIFIHGCFWHGHENCSNAKLPKSNTEFWHLKIERNKERDKENITKLHQLGWRTIEIYQCELKKELKQKTLENLMKMLKNN